MRKKLLDNIFHSPAHLSQDDLDAYLSNEASPALRRKIENSMLDDPLMSDAIEGYEEMNMEALPPFEKFSDFKKKLPPEHKATVRPLNTAKLLLRLAAVGVILILAITGYFAIQTKADQDLFADYYELYQNDLPMETRGETATLQPDFRNALMYYSARDFEAAMPYFDEALQAQPDNDAVRFFAGLNCLELNRTEDATGHLLMTAGNGGSYAHKAHWYAVLATIKAGDTEAAKALLEDFLSRSNYNRRKAEALKAKL